jgi:outer membrane protein OmpA-like peptidoglycan-associated protein
MANEQLRNREGELRRRAEDSERALEEAQRQMTLFGIAVERLGNAATVKKEARGTVITISGQVLFASGKSELLPAASDSLARVADALKDIEPGKKIIVEGHTDSTGSTAYNERLSVERAEHVKTFLASHGVDDSKLEVIGQGEAQPVASNATPEGRANNRRVEIVVADQGKGTEPRVRPAPADGTVLPPPPLQQQPVPPERLQR